MLGTPERRKELNMPFRFERLEIPEVILVEAIAFEDPRGFFMETYNWSAFRANGIPEAFVQDNYSYSVCGVLRGLHYQKPPKAQGKLIGVIRGEIFDVAVDIRQGSPTYGRWVGGRLSAKDRRLLYVPVGFAHGFCVLSSEADIFYKVTAEYAPGLEGGIRWNDAELGIPWPVQDPILSAKDVQLPVLREADHIFVYGGLLR
jgi:dTDP-4-dehydrorhamnose 3,5-epimerase